MVGITPRWTGIFAALPSLLIILRKPTTLMSVPARLKTRSALALALSKLAPRPDDTFPAANTAIASNMMCSDCRWGRSGAARGSACQLPVVRPICAPSVLPEPIEAVGAQFGIPHRVHDVAMTEEVLQRAGVDAVIGELEAAGMTQHVRMN